MKFSRFLITTAFLFYCAIPLFAQSSYEIIINTDSTDKAIFSFENYSGGYITLGVTSNGAQAQEHKVSPVIILHSDSINFSFKTFLKQDTSFAFQQGFQKENGNYFILGSLGDSTHPNYNIFIFNKIYLCELTPDFEILWEKIYEIPEGYNLNLADFLIDQDDNIVLYSTLEIIPYSNGYLYLTKFDMDGEMLCSNFLPDYDAKLYNDIILKPDGTGYYIIGELTIGSGFIRDWFDVDTDLNIVATGNLQGNHFNRSFTAKWLSNENLFIVNGESQETPGAYRDMQVRVCDTNFNTLNDTVFFDPDNVYSPVYDGMDFVYEDLIWTCTFNEDIPFFPGTEIFKVYLFDSNMDLKGMKTYGGDSRWWFYHLYATSDGGCIITGTKREPEGTTLSDVDIYILKVLPEDIITSAEETTFKKDFDIDIYPNPFNQYITVESAHDNLQISIYDLMGKNVLSKMTGSLNKIRILTGNLQTGFYTYKITNNNRIIQNGKLIKK